MSVPEQPKPPAYDPPGRADQLEAPVLDAWRQTIADTYEMLSDEALYLDENGDPEPNSPTLETPFFVLHPEAGRLEGDLMAKWPPDPSVPVYCRGLKKARELCDGGLVGRHLLHAEYAEYQVVRREGRPKRVQVTTELREYWLCVAVKDPDKLRAMVKDVLGFEPSWEDLFRGDPHKLTDEERKEAFTELVAGRGMPRRRRVGIEGAQPTGPLNTEHLLFMTYPLNGLDDLMELLFLGARAWAVRGLYNLVPAAPAAVFASVGAPEFACRRSDPAVMAEATDAAFNGYRLTLANPPGISILGFPREAFSYRGRPLPESWVRLSRGEPGYEQRLEVGPGDDDDAFLDDIFDLTERRPLTGGFQVLRQLELGVRLARAPTFGASIQFELTPAGPDLTPCSAEDRCKDVQRVQDRLDGGPQPTPAVG
jgi:hypothetical protein